MSSFTLVQGLIGLSTKNAHVLRDFLNFAALIIALCFSTRAIDIWNESQQESQIDSQSDDLEGGSNTVTVTKDRHYNFGQRRINLLAAFFNCVFLIFIFVFDWVENVHIVMEHWEEQEKSSLETIVPD
jgi:hypothetical protein